MRFFLLLSLLCLAIAACDTTKPMAAKETAPAATYAGEYAITTSNTPLGTVTGTLTIMENEDGTLGGKYVADGTTFDLKNVRSTDAGLNFGFYFADYGTDVTVELMGAPGAATLEGSTLGEYPTKAVRQ